MNDSTMELPVYTGVISQAVLDDPNHTFSLVVKMVKPNCDVLEIGCATGYMTRYLREQKGCRVTGIEINPQAARVAEPLCARLVIGNVEDPAVLAQAGGPFDVVILADVLEHLVDPAATLARLRSLVRPGGYFVISLPNIAHWSVRRALLFGRWEYGGRGIMDRTHLRFFTLASAVTLLESVGCRVEERQQAYAFPAHWRMNFGPWLAACVQGRHMPRWFDEWFAYQFIFKAALP